MPLTLSGRRVGPGLTEHPSLTDIAVALSRMPRFAGHTGPWFSVLDHTMFGQGMIRQQAGPFTERAWMLHDAHEAITSDVPTDVKGADLRSTQEEMDRLIYGAYHPHLELRLDSVQYDTTLWRVIKEVDSRCLRAEAEVLKGAEIGGRAVRDDVRRLQFMLEGGNTHLGVPPLAKDQHEHPLVVQYVARMVALL